MGNITPSMARNQIGRCLRAIVDRPPTNAEKRLLWRYFESECAYCGTHLELATRQGHLDHLIAHSAGGTNSIYNHTLACGACNGDEKRDESWGSYLRRKAVASTEYEKRHARISEWLAKANSSKIDAEAESKEVGVVIQAAIASFDNAVKRLRSLRDDATPPNKD